MKGLGSVAIPSACKSQMISEKEDVVSYLFFDVIDSFFWMGSNLPVRAFLAVAIAAPDRSVGEAENAVRSAAERCSKFRDAREWKTGTRTMTASACTYEVNLHIEQSWLVTITDPGRRVAMAYRVFQRHATLDRAIQTLAGAMDSFRPFPDQQAVFDEMRGRPERDVQAAAALEAQAIAWIESKGWPKPQLETTVRHGNLAYRLSHEYRPALEIACSVGWRQAGDSGKPDWMNAMHRDFHVDLVWNYEFNGEWRLGQAGQELGFQYEPWTAFKDDAYVSGRVYYFLRRMMVFLYDDVRSEKPANPYPLDAFLNARAEAMAHLSR